MIEYKSLHIYFRLGQECAKCDQFKANKIAGALSPSLCLCHII